MTRIVICIHCGKVAAYHILSLQHYNPFMTNQPLIGNNRFASEMLHRLNKPHAFDHHWPTRKIIFYICQYFSANHYKCKQTHNIFATEKNVLLFFFKTSVLWYSLNHTQQSHTVTKPADTWVFLLPFGIAAHFRASFWIISMSMCTCLFTFYLNIIVWEQENHWSDCHISFF